jgi:hypothetical protein
LLSSPRPEAARFRIREQACEPGGFGFGNSPAQLRQAIVAPTLVVVGRIGSLAQFFDERGFQQPLDHRIERARTQTDTPTCPVSDVLQDGVAMAISIGERDENIEGVPRQWKEIVRFGTLTPRARHAQVYPFSL